MTTRWDPTRPERSVMNGVKWGPYKWVTGSITVISGVINIACAPHVSWELRAPPTPGSIRQVRPYFRDSYRIPESQTTNMDVSENSGFSPKSSILIGFSIIFTIHFGVPLFFSNTHIKPLVDWGIRNFYCSNFSHNIHQDFLKPFPRLVERGPWWKSRWKCW